MTIVTIKTETPNTPNTRPPHNEAWGTDNSTVTWGENYEVVYTKSNKSSDDRIKSSDDRICKKCIVKVCFCLGYLTLIGLILGIIGGGIAYYVFGIKYLVKNYDESEECNSSIGDYVITSLVLSWVLAGGQSQSAKGEDLATKVWANIILGFVWIGIGIWGFIITEEEQCDKIVDTPLWRFANVISIIQLSIGSVSTFICAVTIIWVMQYAE